MYRALEDLSYSLRRSVGPSFAVVGSPEGCPGPAYHGLICPVSIAIQLIALDAIWEWSASGRGYKALLVFGDLVCAGESLRRYPKAKDIMRLAGRFFEAQLQQLPLDLILSPIPIVLICPPPGEYGEAIVVNTPEELEAALSKILTDPELG